MNCKYCNAELEEQNLICPVCGKDNSAQEQPAAVEDTAEAVVETVEESIEETSAPEEMPAKSKKKTWKVLLAVTLSVVLLLGAAAAGWWFYNGGSFLPKENDIFYKDNYTAEGRKLERAMEDVVATMGDRVLTNSELQVYYWMQVYNFLEYYSTSANIDISKPFAEQAMSEDTSWEQYFLELSLTSWNRYQTLCIEAEKEDYTLPEDVQELLNKTLENLEESAKTYDFESAEAMIKADLGPGCSLEAYLKYIGDYYLGVHYFDEIYQRIDPTEEEVSKFFDEHASDFKTQYGVTKTSGKLVDVRHILLSPEGAETDEDGYPVATADQWEACRLAAQAILDEWKAGDATEETFAALAVKHSKDTGSSSNGGLYSGVPTGYMVEAFDAWMFDESRQTGDTGLVKTEFGYHVMYYVGGEEGWMLYGRDALISELCSQRLDELTEENPMEVNYKAIVLGQADLLSNVG